jgi:hypothetical protein
VRRAKTRAGSQEKQLEQARTLSFASQVTPSTNEPRSFRVLLGLSGLLYLAWWFAVEWLLPGAFNPLPGRLAVVGYFFVTFALSFVSSRAQRHSEALFYIGAVLLVGHYFYLFHHNAKDVNWTVGTYVVVLALSVMIQARGWLLVLSAFSLACGVVVWHRRAKRDRAAKPPPLAR